MLRLMAAAEPIHDAAALAQAEAFDLIGWHGAAERVRKGLTRQGDIG